MHPILANAYSVLEAEIRVAGAPQPLPPVRYLAAQYGAYRPTRRRLSCFPAIPHSERRATAPPAPPLGLVLLEVGYDEWPAAASGGVE